ncbi:CmcJ/NvfI family oxidoreductase [Massilia sp. DJPM01]|uniref:CmcJ/NvfI family oxidoreductase n=1 Tax=Massilia sp. DJPM01 TaxID=3024404 RepID=UPI00259F8884|nr:CmcJ/NvfI family oxidoreductase [Massilia sp. DJPM01]MDM5179165.1 CmcJ/NvfI family oxidoreductase [Massilia sp. DJPM01]
MSTVPAVLYYAAPLAPEGREDNWIIDALSDPPALILNFRKVSIETHITELRGSQMHPHLDDAGFEKLDLPTQADQQALVDGSPAALDFYQRETASLLQAMTNASAVVFFDATLRSEEPATPRAPSFQPAHLRVHVDQNPRSARARATAHGGAQRRFRRFQIINIWRPLLAPVRNFPLALCDYRSLDVGTDLVATQLHFPAWLKDRENYSLKYNPGHRWYYWEGMTPGEVVVFKCHDSACHAVAMGDGAERGEAMDVAGLCPHTAFFNAAGPATGRLRTSLELRALLFYD